MKQIIEFLTVAVLIIAIGCFLGAMYAFNAGDVAGALQFGFVALWSELLYLINLMMRKKEK